MKLSKFLWNSVTVAVILHLVVIIYFFKSQSISYQILSQPKALSISTKYRRLVPVQEIKSSSKLVKKRATNRKIQKKKNTYKRSENKQKQQALKSLEKALQEISTQKFESSKGVSFLDDSPKSVKHLNVEGELSYNKRAHEYRETLINFLQNHLVLPEYGSVYIKMDLDPRGRVKKFSILTYESEKNRRYINEVFPSLHFPPIPHGENTDKIQSFSIKLEHNC